MSAHPIILSTKDCSPFDEKISKNYDRVLHHFQKVQQGFEFFSFNSQSEIEEPVIRYDYKTRQWWAGRFIGEAEFEFDGDLYQIKIEPRFGEPQLFRMLSEIFNIRFSESQDSIQKVNSNQIIIRKLISYLWVSMLSSANRYGFPRHSKRKTYKGTKVRGAINVRESIVPIRIESEIVSNYQEKSLDDSFMKVLSLAYQILKDDFFLGEITLNQNAKYSVDQIKGYRGDKKILTDLDFQQIRLKQIYESFQAVLRLSWDIIKSKAERDKKTGNNSSVSYFIDMAEIWEKYIQSLLIKELRKSGWRLINNEFETYNGPVINRKLIPDIVLKNGNQVIVLDAKYKLMNGQKRDIDRSDFFQIHTYIHYLQQEYDVLIGGLIYPFSTHLTSEVVSKTRSNSLFAKEVADTKYCIDGIDLSFLPKIDVNSEIEQSFRLAEKDFLYRIGNLII